MHLWHDIDPLRIKSHLQAIIEIPLGSRQKYEVDSELGILTLSRTLLTACRYPVNYGMIPRTLGLDGDPLDILIFSRESIMPSVLVTARPVGIFDLITNGKSDYKIIAVVKEDPEFGNIQNIHEIKKFRVLELRQFLQTYKNLEKKTVKLGNFLGPIKAWTVIRQSIESYQKKYLGQK
ncbi:MAG: inorganic diphosphatase [Bdellovibrionaceae bacterium]|nr:inorganic diphosphatase [Pseudobdellovibrionaceae bacterium]